MNKIILLIITLLITGYIPQTCATQTQSIESIQKVVRAYIASKLSLKTDYKIKLGQIDPRLRLPKCSEKLKAYTRHQSIKAGRNSIGVKCTGSHQWSIYTSAIILIYKDVIVMAQPMRRGDIFKPDSIKFEKRDISSLRSGFMIKKQNIVNKQAGKNLMLGAVLNKSNIKEPKLIKRGERIDIKATSPNLDITVAGIAMMDGVKGQKIKVKNIKSQRMINATVVQSGLVMVMM